MQYGKGKSCYYRFLTKGQQWIDLATDTLLHNLPPMEFKARVYSLHAHSSQVTQAGCGSVSFILPSTPHFSSDHLTML